MSAIIFKTPGEMDIRSFTTMGVNAKPRTDRPIGYFGTGLKYAVAVLLRLGAKLTVHTGGHRYWFELRQITFRGEKFEQVFMRRDQYVGGNGWVLGRRQKLPFTTMYGRNWEAWMAFRELFSNTLDEHGETWEATDGELAKVATWGKDETVILVQDCEPFTEAFRNRDGIILDLSDRPKLAVLPGVELLEGETKRMFYQGMRAKDLGHQTLFTYNFTHGQTLTEDRQLAHEWALKSTLANTIAAHCEDEAIIEKIVTAEEGTWEHGMAPDSWVRPSAAFHAVMMRRPRGVGSGWGGYYGTHDRRPEVTRNDLWRDALRPWAPDGGDILAADGTPLFSKPFNMNEKVWEKLAHRLCMVANDERAPWEKVLSARNAVPDDFGLQDRRWVIVEYKKNGREDKNWQQPGRHIGEPYTDKDTADEERYFMWADETAPDKADYYKLVVEEICPGHVASWWDKGVCAHCGETSREQAPDDEVLILSGLTPAKDFDDDLPF